jgi:lipid A 3-O-deacylase
MTYRSRPAGAALLIPRFAVPLAIMAALLGGPARACNPAAGDFVSCDDTVTANLIEENDSFLNYSDKHYTQGLRVSFGSAEQVPGDAAYPLLRLGADHLLLPAGEAGGDLRYGLFYGQSIFTPTDLLLFKPDPADRPYAGWLYGGASVYRETAHMLDRFDLTVGLVGPGAGAEYVQNTWHHEAPIAIMRGAHANGWGSQLHDEPGLVLSEERQWRYPVPLVPGTIEADLVPEVNASLGNVFTYAGAGGMVRFGRGLGVDWGQPRVQPALAGSDFVNGRGFDGHWSAWYLFAGSEARLVARNIFLDGNSFEGSAHVGHEPVVVDLTAGAMAYLGPARISVSYTRRTKEFASQANGADEFLAVLLALSF